jgi:hypothetical protein
MVVGACSKNSEVRVLQFWCCWYIASRRSIQESWLVCPSYRSRRSVLLWWVRTAIMLLSWIECLHPFRLDAWELCFWYQTVWPLNRWKCLHPFSFRLDARGLCSLFSTKLFGKPVIQIVPFSGFDAWGFVFVPVWPTIVPKATGGTQSFLMESGMLIPLSISAKDTRPVMEPFSLPI